jgi:hypothetical protein
MPSLMPQFIYEKVRDLLSEPSLDLADRSRRRELLTDAYYYRNGSLYSSIEQEGNLDSFVNNLLRELDGMAILKGVILSYCFLKHLRERKDLRRENG